MRCGTSSRTYPPSPLTSLTTGFPYLPVLPLALDPGLGMPPLALEEEEEDWLFGCSGIGESMEPRRSRKLLEQGSFTKEKDFFSGSMVPRKLDEEVEEEEESSQEDEEEEEVVVVVVEEVE